MAIKGDKTFTCTIQQAHFLNWFINDSLNAEHDTESPLEQLHDSKRITDGSHAAAE